MREPGFYWVRSRVYGRWRKGTVGVAELNCHRWWFTGDSRVPLETDPDVEVLSDRLEPPK